MEKFLFSLAYLIIKAYSSTFRYKEFGTENLDVANGKKIVFAIWHGQLFPFVYLYKHKNIITIVSESKDGEIAAKLLNKFGFDTSRGSSSRNGTKAIIGCKKIMVKKNLSAAITIDGPKGPRLVAKPGAVFLAKITDQIIIPVVCHAKKVFKFNSWDKFIVPYPFSKIEVFYGKPIMVDKDTSKESIDSSLEELQKNMLELTRENSPDFI